METFHSLDAAETATMIVAAAAFALAIISVVVARTVTVRAKKAEEIAKALRSPTELEQGTAPTTSGTILYTLEKKDYLDLWNHFQD